MAPALASQLRQVLIAEAKADRMPLRSILHGRENDGSPLKRAHLHFCPLPHAGFQHANGTVLGVAFILPPDTSDSDRAYVERVVASWLFTRGAELTMAGGRSLFFGPADSRRTLAEDRWCHAAKVWQTVIPMELPHHVARRREWSRDDWFRVRLEMERACTHIGLPERSRLRHRTRRSWWAAPTHAWFEVRTAVPWCTPACGSQTQSKARSS